MEFVIIAALIVSNGLLAMSEIALVSVRKSSLSVEAKEGNASARSALALAENPDRFFSTVQIGITLIGILTGIYSGDAIGERFGAFLEQVGLPKTYAYLAAQGTVLIVATYLTLIFGELVPKRIGLAVPERVAKIVSPPMLLLSKAAAPLVWLLSKSSAGVLKILGISQSKRKVTEREIKSMVREGEESGEVQKVERHIVERVFTLGDRFVESIMTPRNDIVSIDASLANWEIMQLIAKSPHTVYPVTNGSLDELLGVVSIGKLFGRLENPNFSVRSVLDQAFYLKDETLVYNALELMREHRVKNALILNEFGVTLGMVTLNDIIDAVLGDMPEANEEANITPRDDGTFLVDGQCPFHDFLIYFGVEDSSETCNTVGGLLIEHLNSIPQVTEKIVWRGFELEVVDMDGARIDKILVKRLPEESGEHGA